jgi:predicted transcriptional regulator YdeE
MIFSFLACSSSHRKQEEKNMAYQKMKSEGFRIIGIKTRTSNSAEMAGKGKIGPLWKEFMSKGVASKIPGKINHDIVALYYDYESDANGPYSLMIGTKVNKDVKVPEGMVSIEVPAQSYALFTTDQGEIPGIIFKTWKKIWDLSEKTELKRKYTFDYELYGKRASNPKSAQVEIFVAESN